MRAATQATNHGAPTAILEARAEAALNLHYSIEVPCTCACTVQALLHPVYVGSEARGHVGLGPTVPDARPLRFDVLCDVGPRYGYKMPIACTVLHSTVGPSTSFPLAKRPAGFACCVSGYWLGASAVGVRAAWRRGRGRLFQGGSDQRACELG